MLSILTRPMPRFFASSAFVRTQRHTFSRSFITTTRLNFPAAKKPVVKATSKVKQTPTAKATATIKPKPKAEKPKQPKPKKRVLKPRPVGRPRKKENKKVATRIRRLKPEEKPPKQPGSAYALFTAKFFAGQPKGVDVKETVKVCASTWKQLNEREREPFYNEWRERREQYTKDRAAYWDNVSQDTLTILNKQRKRSGKYKIKRHPSEEHKKPLSSYLLFCQDHRGDSDILAQTEDLAPLDRQRKIITLLGQRWSQLDEATKSRYTDEAQKALMAWKARQ